MRAQIDAGRHVVSTSDDPDEVAALLDLGDWARAVGVSVVVGAAMSPGLSCLLAAHASTLLDRVDEVHVARHGRRRAGVRPPATTCAAGHRTGLARR